jgi:hypothetical protein
LPTPGRPNAKTFVASSRKSTHQCRRQTPFVERVEGLSRRELRGPAQALDPALVSLLGLEFEDVEEKGQRRLLFRADESRDQFAGRRREGKARQQGRDLIANGAGRGGAAHAAAPARSAS